MVHRPLAHSRQPLWWGTVYEWLNYHVGVPPPRHDPQDGLSSCPPVLRPSPFGNGLENACLACSSPSLLRWVAIFRASRRSRKASQLCIVRRHAAHRDLPNTSFVQAFNRELLTACSQAVSAYLPPPVLPPTPPACARLSPGGPPSRPFVGPLSRRARPGLRLSWSAVGSLIIGSALSCFASAGPPLVICAYAVPPMDSRKAVATATEISFIAYLRFGLEPNPPGLPFVPELHLRPRGRRPPSSA